MSLLLKSNAVGVPQIFSREGPLVFAAGFGDGGFLVHLARAHPSWNLLGADVSRGSVSRAYRRLRSAGVTHARLYLGKAEFLLRNVVPAGGLHRIYVNFPDPWPKGRHRSRRLVTTSLLLLLGTRLHAGGTLLLTTDDEAYFERVHAAARQTALYEVAVKPPPAAVLRTKYAGKWHAQQRTIHHLHCTRTTAATAPMPPAVTRIAMHHALLTGPLPGPAGFAPFRRVFASGQVVVTGLLQRHGDPGLLFEVRVEEQDLIQDILVEADVIVCVATFGQPLATRGTREAVRAVEGWLTNLGMKTAETYY